MRRKPRTFHSIDIFKDDIIMCTDNIEKKFL